MTQRVSPSMLGLGPSGGDDTAAIQAAVNEGGRVFLTAGTFNVSSTISIALDRTVIAGAGPNKTIINFDPVATASCFDFSKGASSIVQCSISGLGFTSSNSINKTAIRIVDGRHCTISDIGIAQGAWLGAASKGIHTLGRDTLTATRLAILCARPVLIDVNPNYPTLHCDHFHFSDCELGTTDTGGNVIEIANGVNISNLTFDGYQAWELGKYGIFWDDTTSTVDSTNLTISGMRSEQGADATGYSVYLASTAQDLKALRIEKSYFDSGRNGVYLRKPETVTIADSFFSGGVGRTNLNVTFQANTELQLANTFVNTGSTVTLTSGTLLVESPWIAANRACAATALWRYDEGALVSRKSQRRDGVLGFRWKGSMTDVSQINLPVLLSGGAIVATWRVAVSGATKFEGGAGVWKPGTAPLILSSPVGNLVNVSTALKFAVIDSSNGLCLVNRLGETVTVVAEAVWAD